MSTGDKENLEVAKLRTDLLQIKIGLMITVIGAFSGFFSYLTESVAVEQSLPALSFQQLSGELTDLNNAEGGAGAPCVGWRVPSGTELVFITAWYDGKTNVEGKEPFSQQHWDVVRFSLDGPNGPTPITLLDYGQRAFSVLKYDVRRHLLFIQNTYNGTARSVFISGEATAKVMVPRYQYWLGAKH